MGLYERSKSLTANGSPVFVMHGNGNINLYRNPQGHWLVTSSEQNIADNTGLIRSTQPTAWPTDEGVAWAVMGGWTWQLDTSITCTGVSVPL